MCGIIGVFSNSGGAQMEALTRMRDTMRHRGPDDSGLWWSADGKAGLAHRRLSIIDLSSGGHQPMHDGRQDVTIVFNGEVYNHVELRAILEAKGHSFQSHSDTEVIIKSYLEWGEGCLDRLNGAYAFAIYDGRRRTALLARDRAGEKPLFYWHDGQTCWFASELKALMEGLPFLRVIDLSGLQYYLAYGYVPHDGCILKGVRKLPPAHALTLDLRKPATRIWAYWCMPAHASELTDDLETLTDELEGLLRDAVRRQMVADVPIGVLLSGGVDSSLVTAIAAKVCSGKVRTFNISFPGHAAYDEAPYARLVASHFGTDHVELAAQPATFDLLPQLAWQYDEPIADSSMLPTFLVSKLIRQHCTVALGGDGGDELFGGYPFYSWLYKHAKIREYIPDSLRRGFAAFARACLPIGAPGRTVLMGSAGDIGNGMAHFNLFFDAVARRALVPAFQKRDESGWDIPEKYKQSFAYKYKGIPLAGMAMDFHSYLPEDILVKVDRASMLASLEVRAPFLDRYVMEFAFSKVPNHLRATPEKRKILLRHLGKRLLPPTLDLKRKQGFSLPLQSWMQGEWKQYITDVLFDQKDALFDQKMLRSLWNGQCRGLKNTQRIFSLVILKLWMNIHKISVH
ncbi:MAG: asparagine synthase (glutamine-hydrolyzing) [Nibricoccus sp.]